MVADDASGNPLCPTNATPHAPPQQLAIAATVVPIENALRELQRGKSAELYFAAATGGGSDSLEPAEAEVASRMAANRRESFEAGRAAAGQALRRAGQPRTAILSDEDGVPIFPHGYLGSLAHKHGFAVAVVGPVGAAQGLGIDLEFDDGLDDADLLATVLADGETDVIQRIARAMPALGSPVTLLLSAKESVYKAVFPLTRLRFDFDEVRLSIDPDAANFRAVQFPGSENFAVTGRYATAGQWIVSLATAEG